MSCKKTKKTIRHLTGDIKRMTRQRRTLSREIKEDKDLIKTLNKKKNKRRLFQKNKVSYPNLIPPRFKGISDW